MASYRRLAPGNWQYIISYINEHGDEKQKTKSKFPTKAAAKKVAEPLELEMKRNKNLVDSTLLFTDYYKKWIKTYKIGLFSKETDKIYKTVEKLVDKHFKGVTVEGITMDKYQQFLNTLATTLSKETVRKYHNKVGACLRHAFHTGVIPIDVTYKATITGKSGKDPLDKFLEEAELKKVVQELQKNNRYEWTSRYMLLLQSATGMRLAEVMAITLEDVDIEEETLRINKSWDYKHTKTFKDTKNGVHRTIDLDPTTVAWLKKYMTFQRTRMLSSVVKNHNNLLFTDDKFEPISEKAINNSLRAACQRAGVKEHTSHALRHTHASILLLHGVDIQIVAERLGDTPDTISKVYAHVMEGMRDRNKDEIKKITASIL